MKTLEDIKNTLLTEKENLRNRYHVSEIGVFGSFVRGEQTEQSDVDVLVDFDGEVSLFDLVYLEDYLQDKIGIKVDLVLKSALKPYIGKRILQEVIYL